MGIWMLLTKFEGFIFIYLFILIKEYIEAPTEWK